MFTLEFLHLKSMTTERQKHIEFIICWAQTIAAPQLQLFYTESLIES